MKACRRYEVRLKSTRDELSIGSGTVEFTLTLLEDHARFNGLLPVLLPYSEKNARELLELLKVLVEKAKLQAEAERLR
ncbi:hypothetical protein E3E38_09265 [Thermococcus sp. 18S1]|uniref:hypothetical protein n=1 Tax=Thermococcus sp. 18S1 TaxID=1638210 RepID=UPI00143C9CA6|nr:hypothetical protein [Thermococcus sp. 18S1]NJE31229.1 hypothetical protein [Thermococcus sp. 18S1]